MRGLDCGRQLRWVHPAEWNLRFHISAHPTADLYLRRPWLSLVQGGLAARVNFILPQADPIEVSGRHDHDGQVSRYFRGDERGLKVLVGYRGLA